MKKGGLLRCKSPFYCTINLLFVHQNCYYHMSLKNKSKGYKYLVFLISLPALFFGVYTMTFLSVPKSIWQKNIAFDLIIILLSIGYSLFNRQYLSQKNNKNSLNGLILLIFLLITPFLVKDIDGVQRWITILGFRLNIGLMITPLLIIQIDKLHDIKLALLCWLTITIIFLIQPDASQVMAFCFSTIIILWSKNRVLYIKILLLIVSLASTAFAWFNLDHLPAVDYVERIQQISAQISWLYYVCSLTSLLLLLYPFFINKSKSKTALSLGLYFALLLLATFWGNFPVFIMGYGISPIIGYYIALTWLVNNDN